MARAMLDPPGSRENSSSPRGSVTVFDAMGNQVAKMELPRIFNEPLRMDLIKRAVLAIQSRRFQPHGASPIAGIKYSAESWGVGYGLSRVPRLSTGRAAKAPGTVKGRQAHPPNPEKNPLKKINRKERRLAIRSAIAATGNPELVRARGHRFQSQLPIVVKGLESLSKTSQVVELAEKLGFHLDLERAAQRKIRPGRGKLRARKYKIRKSVLFVVSRRCELMRAARNLPGVDVCSLRNLNAELLAPGAHPGRLVVWSLEAFNQLDEFWGCNT